MSLLKTQDFSSHSELKPRSVLCPAWPCNNMLSTRPLLPVKRPSHAFCSSLRGLLTVPGTCWHYSLLFPLWNVLPCDTHMAWFLLSISFLLKNVTLSQKPFLANNLSKILTLPSPLDYWHSIIILSTLVSTLSPYSILLHNLPVFPIFECQFFECFISYL